MSWYAMAVKWWADEDVEAARPWAWPIILDAIKSGNGVASARALSDARLIRAAGLVGQVADSGASILESFVAVGLVVEVEGGFTARSWDEYQRSDDAKKERQRRWRDKKRLGDVSETSRDVSATPDDGNGDVARLDGDATRRDTRRLGDVVETATVHNMTRHDEIGRAHV